MPKNRYRNIKLLCARLPRQSSMWLAVTVYILIISLAPAVFAQSRHTDHTLKLDDPSLQPRASIGDVSWLTGLWEGKGFGGTVEEVWGSASAGTMVGMVKLVNSGQPSLYEFELIVEEEGSLTYKLRHFNADFSAREDKANFVSLPLVKLDEQAVYFHGLTYQRMGPDQLQVYVANDQNGKLQEEELIYRRVR